ncbi:MAG: Uma2 family endonuclease [Thermoleophilaceae bacterium]
MPATRHMTADEYLALPFSPERRWVQLVEGELVVDQPLLLHQVVKSELQYALSCWVRAGGGRGLVTPPIDVKLDERNVFGPDLLWYPEETAPDVHAGRPYPVPRLAIEIRSPSTWRYDIGPKKAAYERARLRELWLVDTAASEVLVFRRSTSSVPAFDVALELERTDVLTSPQLDGFELSLADLFPE